MLILHLISFIVLFFANKFYILIIALFIFGIGTGLSNIIYMRNCWLFFPQNQGLVNGIIISSTGLVSTFLIALADYIIINPNKEETKNGIYPKNVADNVEIYIKIVVVILGAFDIIGFFLIFDHEKLPETIEEKMRKLNENRKDSLATIDINISAESSTNVKLEVEKLKNKSILKQLFFTKTNLKFLTFCFFGFCKFFFIFK